MAITLNAVGTVSANVGSGNMTPGLPANFVYDDLHLCLITSGDNVVSTMPAGWNLLQTLSNTAALQQTIYWRFARSADTAPTVTHAAGNSGLARIIGFRNTAISKLPVDACNSGTVNAASTTCTANAIIPRYENEMLVFLGSGGKAADTSIDPVAWSAFSGTNPAFTDVGANSTGLGTNEATQDIAYGIKTDNLTTGNRTATLASSIVNIGTLISIKPPTIGSAENIGLYVAVSNGMSRSEVAN